MLFRKLWKDDGGALITVEWVFVATILVLGVITGLVAVRQAVTNELEEFANAVMSLSQSYSFSGLSNCASSTSGSAFQDSTDAIPLTNTPVPTGQIGSDGDPCQ